MRFSRSYWGCALALVATRTVSWWARPFFEQTYVHMRVAENFAQGQGLVFNPGEPWEPLQATLAPLYSALLGVLVWAGVDAHVAVLLIAVIAGLFVLWAIGQLLGEDSEATLLARMAYACLPQLARVGAGGGEMPLCLGLVMVAIHARGFGGGLAAALAAALRPEALLVCLWRRSRSWFAGWLVVAAVLFFSLGYQHGLPSVDLPERNWSEHTQHVLKVLSNALAPHWSLLVLLPFTALGLRDSWRRKGALASWTAFGLGCMLVSLFLSYPRYHWHYAPLWLSWCIWTAVGLEQRAARWKQRWLIPLASAASLGVLFAVLWRSPVRWNVHEPLIAWARATSELEPRARILASDIGAVGYGWHGTVLASEGWLWPHAARLQEVNNMLREEQPEYFVMTLDRGRWQAYQADAWVVDNYRPITRFAPDASAELAPNSENLDGSYRADYLVFKRQLRSQLPQRELTPPGPNQVQEKGPTDQR